ncbi:DUF4138 domain-containing protein [Allomuricauda taeanensis]|uniref:DUF4138 domain-containing protein n=1 Tax=Flagellimonas taeanensis TaxID=1005926 RepID=UPI002E7ABE17|nr:DUF4138 domain-containing protein [Allomuricauda taeanensis]MEE1964578.1 DUF4138 domain-containing protein [Allomuricauda taeanensis]
MKKILLLSMVFMTYSFNMFGQSLLSPLTKVDTLLISDVKTTHLVFNEGIQYVDIGSPYFVADTLQQMIRVKHIGQGLDDTKSNFSNLTVITGDGGYYSMILEYNPLAPLMSYKIKKSDEFIPFFRKKKEKEEVIQNHFSDLCAQIEGFRSKNLLRNKRNEDLKIFVTGIFYIDEKIGIRMELRNESTIDFDIDHILFRTKLKKRFSPDYLYQERLISPLYTCPENMQISGKGYTEITLLFDKFMPNKNERLFIDIFEQNGGRSATILIPRRTLIQPKILPTNEN